MSHAVTSLPLLIQAARVRLSFCFLRNPWKRVHVFFFLLNIIEQKRTGSRSRSHPVCVPPSAPVPLHHHFLFLEMQQLFHLVCIWVTSAARDKVFFFHSAEDVGRCRAFDPPVVGVNHSTYLIISKLKRRHSRSHSSVRLRSRFTLCAKTAGHKLGLFVLIDVYHSL